MIKNLLLLLLLVGGTLHAQLNVSLVGELPYTQDLNDIWGYAAPDGTEYAMVGTRTGTSIVSLADPANPVELFFIPGDNSTWRDLKTFGDYLYVTTDTGDDGLLVVDLTQLPAAAPHFFWTPDLPNLGVLETCHNLYIDEDGYVYLVGCNINSGGSVILDVFTDPGNPEFVVAGPSVYAHDVYVQDGISYSSEIFNGTLTLYDVTDKNNIQFISSQPTPFDFTHNAWVNDEGTMVFTTDERADAFVAAYDISDPTDIVETDRYRPLETLGEGVIPHNVHVYQDWLIISYYTDGGIVVDASNPGNLIEVGNFDTFFGNGQGFQGAWGAYPFLPSERILITDIGNGLYVLEPNYVNAAWLEGTVTDEDTGAAIFGASVNITDSDQLAFDDTDLAGDYETGLATAGTYQVLFTAPGYEDKTVSATLVNGEITILNVQLTPLATATVNVQVLDMETGLPVEGASVRIANETYEFVSGTNVDGFSDPLSVFLENYQLVVGKWGYEYAVQDIVITTEENIVLEIGRGYRDDFVLDYGWTTESNATSGFWERGVPIGTFFGNGNASAPNEDVEGDLGNQAYVTQNAGGGVGDFDVDNGVVQLFSPPIDVSDMNNPQVNYRLWFVNGGGQGPSNDDMSVYAVYEDGGTQIIELETIDGNFPVWRPESNIVLSEYPTIPLDNFRIMFETSDFQGSGHIVEAGVDAFSITEAEESANFIPEEATAFVSLSPNPTETTSTVSYRLERITEDSRLMIYNSLGQLVEAVVIDSPEGMIQLGASYPTGTYTILVRDRTEQISSAQRLVKL